MSTHPVREAKDTALHPTQASYCSSPHFIWSYENNGAVKIADLRRVGGFIWKDCVMALEITDLLSKVNPPASTFHLGK